MADTAPTSTKPPTSEKASAGKSCCGWTDWTYAAILLRVCSAALLILSGTDKFKSSANPATYSLENYYGTDAELKEGKVPKMVKIVNVVFVNSGLDNAANFGSGAGVHISRAFAWSFYRFAQVLPWLMIGSGFMILLGLCNRLGHFIGGFVWISLIIGQLMLPDIETVVRLLAVFLVSVGALALHKHNRLCLSRC